ncbi:MAG TPA: cytochrome c [Gemmatimonadales bacterium]|nr:cytochrome c [Gemmatimonadales bacterium]
MTLPRWLRRAAGGLALLLAAAASAPPHAAAQAPAGAPPALDPAVVDSGRAIFHGVGTCHACHGDALQGGPVAPSLRGPQWRHIDGTYPAILDRVQHGRSGTLMIAYPGDINDTQAVQVATYVWAVSQGKAVP